MSLKQSKGKKIAVTVNSPRMHEDFKEWNEISNLEMTGAMLFEANSPEALPKGFGEQSLFMGRLILGVLAFAVVSAVLESFIRVAA